MSLNLYYIRAAIEDRTGQRLSFAKIRQLLVEEQLITQKELDDNPMAHEFAGYGRYYFYTPETKNDFTVDVPIDPQSYLNKDARDYFVEEEFDES